jgi:cytochrome c oxidase subunit 2
VNSVQSMFAPAGDQAAIVERLWHLMLWVCVPVYVLVLATMLWALWRTRRIPASSESSDRGLAGGLIGFVVVVACLLTLLIAGSFLAERHLHRPADDPLEVRVTAKQWWWQVEYLSADPSQGFVTANELHLPVGRPVRVVLRTEDVIHSLWIPVLGGKEDMIPGRNNELIFTARRAGKYRGLCAEFCGLQHAHMAFTVEVEDDQSFMRWRAHQLEASAPPTSASAVRGRDLFQVSTCASCHSIKGTQAAGVSGPDLTHLAQRNSLAAGTLPFNRGTLAAWISDPQQHKPGTNMPPALLQGPELGELVDYLMGLQ